MSAGSWVFVRNCPSTVTPQQLYHLFQATVDSPVVSVKVVVGGDPQHLAFGSAQVHRGSIPTALIGFIRRDAAETAENKLHGRHVDGAVLKVIGANNNSPSGPRPLPILLGGELALVNFRCFLNRGSTNDVSVVSG